MAVTEIVSRPMRWPDDATALHRLVAEAWARLGPRVSLHAGDLYWRTALRETRDFQVWEDPSGRALGLVEQDPRDSSCDIVVRPEHLSLERDLFLWAEAQARRRGLKETLTVGCFDDNRERHALLTSLGYERTSHFYPHYLRSLDRVDRVPEPPGYAIRALGGPDEVARRVELGGVVFGGTVLTATRYDALRAGPGYDRELDLVAVDPAGGPAAFCTGWHDPVTQTGELEPIGCHPDHRRRGVTSALITEGLCRLRARGARQVVVYTGHANVAARSLYEALGFRVIGEDYDYAKPL